MPGAPQFESGKGSAIAALTCSHLPSLRGLEMNSLKALLTSPRSFVIFAVIAALITFFVPEYFDRLLLGGSIYPLGLFERSFIAIVVGSIALLAGLALHLIISFFWNDSLDGSRRPARKQRRRGGRDGGFEGGHGHSAETTAAGLFVGGEMSAADTEADGTAGFENYGDAFGGGDAGGGGGGGDFGGGDGGGGDGGGAGGGGGD